MQKGQLSANNQTSRQCKAQKQLYKPTKLNTSVQKMQIQNLYMHFCG